MFYLILKPERFANEIYHYTDIETCKKILKSEGLTFRMTHVKDFTDKFEGRTIEVFYDMALEHLLKCGKISDDLYWELAELEIPNRDFFFFNTKDYQDKLYTEVVSTDYDVYIACFSENAASSYMEEHYIKNEKHNGCAIGLFAANLESNNITLSFGEGSRFRLKKVLYGEQIVNRIIEITEMLLNAYNEDIAILKEVKLNLQQALLELRYTAKRSRYKNENEVRLILMIPKGERVPNYYTPRYEPVIENGKKYIEVPLPKCVFSTIEKSNSTTEEEFRDVVSMLRENGYKMH